MDKKTILFLVTTGFIVLADQLAKAWIMATMQLHDAFPVIDGLFSIVHVRNPGAAFGFLAGMPPLFRSTFFIAVTAAAILLILHYLRQARIDQTAYALALCLILAGALGNLIDRIRFGEVVDFLDFYIGARHWPAFNVADAAITIGAAVLVILLLRKKPEGRETGVREG